MTQPHPPVGVEELNHQEWLKDPLTVRFFEHLEKTCADKLLAAAQAAASHQTGIGNAREHNRLIEAHTYRKIIETYANPKSYPYRASASE